MRWWRGNGCARIGFPCCWAGEPESGGFSPPPHPLSKAGVSHPRTPVGYLDTYERGGGDYLCLWQVLDKFDPSAREGEAVGISVDTLRAFALEQNLCPAGVHLFA